MTVCWGSAFHRGGGVAIETYDSMSLAVERLRKIALRRYQRGYLAAPPTA